VEVRESAGLSTLKNPAPAIRRLAAMHPGEVYVLHKMPRSVHLAMESLGLPAVVFGSTLPGVTLPTVDVNFAATARHAVGRCLAAGRARIALLLHRTELAGDTIILEEIKQSTGSRGLAPPLVLRHDFNRSRLIHSLDRLIADRRDRPDVIIIVNQHHLLTALPHLLHRGIRIPEDLALVFLANDPVVERLSPLPDRYDTGSALPRSLAKACLTLLAGVRPPCHQLIPRSLPGETLPPAKKR
jgi:DNA-binding LacI/PurR family transcriptional regulator